MSSAGPAQEQLEQVARRAVEAAIDAGASDAEAWCERSVGRQVRVYEGAVDSLTDAGARGLGLRVFVEGRSGYAYGTDLGDDAVRALAGEAQAAAAAADPDEFAGLPAELGATAVEGLHSPSLAGWSAPGPS